MNIIEIKKRIVIQGLRLNAAKCGDMLGLWVFAHKINETLCLELDDDILTECAKHVQRGLLLPDLEPTIIY